jgi:hypothetical protein
MGGAAAIQRVEALHLHAGRVGIDREHGRPSRSPSGRSGVARARHDQQQVGRVAMQHQRLATVEHDDLAA